MPSKLSARFDELRRTLSPARLALSLLAIAAVIFVVWFVLTEPGRQARRAVAAEAGKTLGDARTESATNAIAKVGANADAAGRIDDRTRGSEDAIRNAAPADRDDTALRELCKSPSASRRPECRLLKPGP